MKPGRWAAVLVVMAAGSFPVHGFKGDGKQVDSGSFAILMQGRRVGTETFSIRQKSDASVIEAQLKVDNGTEKADQSSELQIASNGDVRRYEWHEHSGDKAKATVEYKDQFLVEYVTTGAGAKPVERAFMLPPSTVILDDFFTHREVVLWRYLASFCANGINEKCKPQPAKFGVFNPHQQASVTLAISYEGKDKVTVHGQEQELDRFKLESDDAVWSCWMESASPYRLMRIVVPSENIEVVRE